MVDDIVFVYELFVRWRVGLVDQGAGKSFTVSNLYELIEYSGHSDILC